MSYQSHDGEQATSDSRRKLERIKLPESLVGKAVLDIGCNEGFFCAEAKRRGAARVVGLDNADHALEFARNKYSELGIEFVKGTWDVLPAGQFDVVLWLSAMHYETDPQAVLRRIGAQLAPGGVLILECGIHDTYSSQMVPVLRPRDVAWYPTLGYIPALLGDFAFRLVSAPETTPGDPTPRSVFHCSLRQTTVLLLRGKSAIGKSSLTRLLENSISKAVLIDSWLELLSAGNLEPTPFLKHLVNHFSRENIERVCQGIDDYGYTDDFVGLLAKGVAASDKLVMVDGFLTDLQAAKLAAALATKARVFVVDRALYPERLAANLQSPDFVPATLQALTGFNLVPPKLDPETSDHELDIRIQLGIEREQVASARRANQTVHAERNELRSTLLSTRASAESEREAAGKKIADLERAVNDANAKCSAAESMIKKMTEEIAVERLHWETERAAAREHVLGMEDRAARAEQYNAALLEEIAKAKAKADTDLDALGAQLLEVKSFSNTLVDRIAHAEQYSLRIRAEFEAAMAQWDVARAESESYAATLLERAVRAEDYNQQLLTERAQSRQSYEADRAARERELVESRQYVISLTERAARSETYSQSLLSELSKTREAMASEQLLHQKEIIDVRTANDALKTEVLAAEKYRQLPWWRKLRE